MNAQERNKAIVRDFLSAVNRRDLDAMDQWFAEDVVRHCQATPDVNVRCLQDFKDFLEADFQVCPDSEQVLRRLVAEGDYVTTHATYIGTQKGQMGPFPPSNKKMELDYIGIMRFENGKVVEIWVTWDNMYALSQLGHLNSPGLFSK